MLTDRFVGFMHFKMFVSHLLLFQNGEGRDKTDRHNMIGFVANDKGGNIHTPLNATGGVRLPFSNDIHNKIAWIGQTVKKDVLCCGFSWCLVVGRCAMRLRRST